jgi:hypothetical protein
MVRDGEFLKSSVIGNINRACLADERHAKLTAIAMA